MEAEIEVRDGRILYHEIIEFAKGKNADLILINSHKPWLGDYLLGSTASKVVSHSPCSVLFIDKPSAIGIALVSIARIK